MGYNFTKENAAEYGRIAGIKSGESRRRKAELKNIARDILAMPIKNGELEDFDCIEEAKDKNLSLMERIFLIQALKAYKGDRQAAEFCFKYGGMEPDQKLNVEAEVSETNDELTNVLEQLIDYKKTSKYFTENSVKKNNEE